MVKPQAYWLNALNLSFGSHRVRKFLVLYGPAENVWNLSPAELLANGILPQHVDAILERKKHIDPEQEWDRLQKENIETVSIDDERYPPLLKTIYSPPLLLYVRGNTNILASPSLAVVGTRRYSSYGKLVIERLLPELARTGLIIVSGLAQGIDTLAHTVTLSSKGLTVAVLGNGIDTIVPTANIRLANEILKKDGAIITEYPWGTPPLKQHFPARNRIIAGLSLGTLVIESRLPGGSLITAEHALEEGREVFAVPGPITGPSSEGTNKLIQEGAHAVTSPEDILDVLSISPNFPVSKAHYGHLSAAERVVLDALEAEPLYIDAIIKHTKLTPQEANARLTALELKGIVRNIGGNTYQRLK